MRHQHKNVALYERLSHDDEQLGESNSISHQFGIFMSLRNHKSKVFDHMLVPYTAAVENNELYKMFDIKVPARIPWKGGDPRDEGFPELLLEEPEEEIDDLPVALL